MKKKKGCKKFKAKTSLDKKSKGCGKDYLFFNGMSDVQSVCGKDGLCSDCKAKNHSPHFGVTPVKKGEKSTPLEDTPSDNSTCEKAEPEGTFNLSEKIQHNEERLCPWDYLEKEDVKEAIRKLKDKIVQVEDGIALIDPKAIDKIFGSLSE